MKKENELRANARLISKQAPHSSLLKPSSRIQKSDSNTASPGTNHWLSDDWDSNSEASDIDLISTFKSRKTTSKPL